MPQYGARPAPMYQQPQYAGVQQPAHHTYKAPNPVEVYILNDHANASIPEDIRAQFQRDEQGRVLFFTAPPVNTEPVVIKGPAKTLGHSARYLAGKAEWEAERAEKRKARDAAKAEHERAAKKARTEEDEQFKKDIAELGLKAVEALGKQLAVAARNELDGLFGGDEAKVREKVGKWVDQLSAVQRAAIEKNLALEKKAEEERRARKIVVTGMTVHLEDKKLKN